LFGKDHFVVMNVHLHHMTAKRAAGHKVAHDAFWPKLAFLIRQYKVDILAGDFNMSMFCVTPQLKHFLVDACMAGAFAWTLPWDAGRSTNVEDRVMIDSVGIWVVHRLVGLRNWFTYEHLLDKASDLPTFARGQGYTPQTYRGAPKCIQDSFDLSRQMVGLPLVDERFEDPKDAPWPRATSKPAHSLKWDPNNELFRMGGHAPILLFIGDKPKRSEKSIERRGEKYNDRMGKGTDKGKGRGTDRPRSKSVGWKHR